MTDGEKEVAALVEKWMERLAKVTTGYESAVKDLREVEMAFQRSWWEKCRILAPYLTPIIMLLIAWGVIRFSRISVIEFGNFKIVKEVAGIK